MANPPAPIRATAEVFWAFLWLGLTSFGGPIAHLGYFHAAFVRRRHWLSEAAWADLVALCQFLPGPASSQVGFAIGLMRAGWPGAIAAFLGFTLPSALVLFALAQTASSFEGPLAAGALQGLKLVAVAVVAHAVLGMAKSLCPDRARAAIAAGAVVVLAISPNVIGMALAMGLGAVAGLALASAGPRAELPPGEALQIPVSHRAAAIAAALLLLLLMAPMLLPATALAEGLATFSRAGALVFGGGHLVLPWLEAGTVASGQISADQFLAGYAAAQAMPGPLFAFAAWLGALMSPGPSGAVGALLALSALFLPGFLLLTAALPFWNRLRQHALAQSVMQGANAAVVGLLAAALYDPVFTASVGDLRDFALALVCFTLLSAWRAPPWAVVVLGALGGIGLGWAR